MSDISTTHHTREDREFSFFIVKHQVFSSEFDEEQTRAEHQKSIRELSMIQQDNRLEIDEKKKS